MRRASGRLPGRNKSAFFRHHVERECSGARETALHLFAKQVICQQLEVALPASHFEYDLGRMIAARQEVRLGGIVPDVLVDFQIEQVAIEVWVAHQVPVEKILKFDELKLAAFEIDLRNYRFVDTSEEHVRAIVLHEAERAWLFPPRQIREARERLRAQRLADVEQMQRQAIRVMEEARAALLKVVRDERQKQEAVATEAEARATARRIQQRLERELDANHAAELRAALAQRRRQIRLGPDLQALVRAHGGYQNITPEAWAAFDAERAVYQERVRSGYFYSREFLSDENNLEDMPVSDVVSDAQLTQSVAKTRLLRQSVSV